MILLSILCVGLFLSYLVGKQGEKKEIGFKSSANKKSINKRRTRQTRQNRE